MAPDTRAAVRYVWITVGLAAAATVWYAVYAAAQLGPVVIGYVFVPLGGAVAARAVHRLCVTRLADPIARRFWCRVVAGLGILTAGYGAHAVDVALNSTDGGQRAMSVPAAACAALGFVVLIWAVARVPLGTVDRDELWRRLLDRAIGFLGCATALWHFGLGPMLTAAEPWSAQTTSLVALAFVLAIVGVTKVSYLGAGPVDPTALRLVSAIGFAAAAVAVLAVNFGDAGALPSQAVVMPLGPVLATLAVRAQARALTRRRTNGLLPYAAIAAVDVPLLVVALGPLRWTDRVVLVAAVAVTALIAVRQFIAARENRALHRERRQQQKRLEHEATHDGLTGLANRTLFRQRLATALRDGDGATVLLIDLDEFKAVNDSLGHDVGDRLLVSVASALRANVADDGLAVRIGGDEFAVLIAGTAQRAGDAVAQRVLAGFGGPIGEDRLLIQASIGIATGVNGTSVDHVLRDADAAMYAAKQRGKAGYVRYVPGMEEPVITHAQLGGELRRALDEGQFRVVYQPVITLDDGRIVGVEALVRWDHPTRGAVSPAEFIPAAERTGLIIPLGRFVLREASRQAAAWLATFGPGALDNVAVNVSARQLNDPEFVADVVAALAASGLPSARLVLELTESAALRGRAVSQTLHEVDAMGVRLALDDFGTGESSLSLLRSFPAAILKLDKSFVDGIDTDDAGPAERDAQEAVARAVIQLAGALGLDAVAEGIETAAQARRLRELGYALGQGYHLARPMPAEELARLLARSRATAITPAAA
jgi:diguanylate cyclase (GGDEF)-like protein